MSKVGQEGIETKKREVNSNIEENLLRNWLPRRCHDDRIITTVLSDMDVGITPLEQRREKTGAIKQGMMQELLTGKTRLIKPEEMT